MDSLTIQQLKDMVFKLVGCNYNGNIQVIDFDGVSVQYDGNQAIVGCNSKSTFLRGCFLLAKELSKGSTSFQLNQKPHFKRCGVMLDASRNGVMRVDAVKKYMENMAALGLNCLMLYTEDTYTIPEYPHFGYLRGRYTEEELKSIDDYGDYLGIEVIPCIQTLAHLEQFIQWDEGNAFADTHEILMIDDPKTYEFIECAIRALRKCFRSNRIHLGMDEAHDVGLGRYLDKHGYQNRFELLNRHIDKVVDICKKYDYDPMMWSDMYFRLGSKIGEYNDLESNIPQEVIDKIPDIKMVYWNYYSSDPKMYDAMIKAHQNLGREVIFAGGIWTWIGMLPSPDHTFNTMFPALDACCDYNMNTVFATMWGDDGTETNHFMTLSLLPMFSEYCYSGKECTKEQIIEAGEFLTKVPHDFIKAISSFHYLKKDDFKGEFYGKSFFYSDVFYNIICPDADFAAKAGMIYEESKNEIKKLLNTSKANDEMYSYAYQIYCILTNKAKLLADLKPKYLAKDKEYLTYAATTILPELKSDYETLFRIHKKQWMDTYKVNGFEVLNARYGAMIYRMEYAIETIMNYVNGVTDRIEELDCEILYGQTRGYQFKNIVTVTKNF